MSSRQRSLEQERAKRAWGCVSEVKARGDKLGKEYGGLARSTCADLQTGGLGQMLAFLRAKGYENGRPKDNGHRYLVDDISAWVMRQLNAAGDDLLRWVTDEASSVDYRRATSEAMAFAAWLKRFAESELPTGERDEH